MIADVADEFGVSPTYLHRKLKLPPTERAIIDSRDGSGRKKRLSDEEEALVLEAMLEFQRNETPVNKGYILELAQTLIYCSK